LIDWPEIEHRVFMPVFDRLPVTLVRGKGCEVWDDHGRRYLDFVGGIATDSLGHCHPVLVNAVTHQVRKLTQTSNLFYTVPQLRLAELLVQHSCCQRVFFGNSGAEVTEGAVKLARRWGHLQLGGAYEVITAEQSFHGRTLAMTAATGQKKFQQAYAPLPAGFVNVPYGDVQAIKNATGNKTCAVMLEPIQGEGGVNVPPEGYLSEVRAWCDAKNLLLILDEVQTGLGRTGSLFAYQQAGVEPDVLVLAKGLASGFPIGAFLAKERASVFAKGDHGSTFGGNPLACAAGFAVAGYIIKEKLSQQAAEMGERMTAGLILLKAEFPLITEVRGRGLLQALQLNKEVAKDVVMAALAGGLLVNNVKADVLRLMPPLIVTPKQIDTGLAILHDALAAVAAVK
jgi:acetylornithine/N-succinyldiaminopimelate aminotransferase